MSGEPEQVESVRMRVREFAAGERPRLYTHRPVRSPARLWKQLRAEGFRLRDHEPFSLRPPVDWAARPREDINWSYQLNAFYPLAPVYSLLLEKRNPVWLRFARDAFLDWERYHCQEGNSHEMAWHDMATGVRATLLAQHLWHEQQLGEIGPEDMVRLLRLAEEHIRVLAAPRRFANYNHGLFQVVGIAALCEVIESPLCESALSYAKRQFAWLFTRQFNEEGIHLEHSPEYHVLGYLTFRRILDSGLLSLPPEVQPVLERAQSALQWFTRPDGSLAELGDTECRSPPMLAPIDPTMAWLVSQGAEGSPPDEGLKLFPRAGYAAYRQTHAPGGASWAIFSVAHHSGVHKHADTFTFEWWDRGAPVIVDSGKWGYASRAPERKYVLSSRAHNVVEIIGAEVDLRLIPEESNEIRGEEAGGVYILAAHGTHAHRWRAVKQRRWLIVRPGHWMVVLDDLRGLWPRRLRQWFQLPPRAELAGWPKGGFRMKYSEHPDALLIQPLEGKPSPIAYHGEEEPRPNGWYSPQYGRMEPSWQLGFERCFRRGRFVTLLCWEQQGDSDDGSLGGELPWMAEGSLNWAADGRVWRLDGSGPSPFAMPVSAELTKSHRKWTGR